MFTKEGFREHPCYKYAEWASNKNNKFTGVYIKKACKNFLKDYNNENSLYYFDFKLAKKICDLLHCINFATGEAQGQSIASSFFDWQYFLILNIFCVKRKSNGKRRYEQAICWISRKNSKSVNVSIIVLLELLLEKQYSQFFSASNTREQASLIFNDLVKIIRSSPYISKHFKILKGEIICTINDNSFKTLSSDSNTMDGRKCDFYCLDEAGAMQKADILESLQSSQLSVAERLGFVISTAYPTMDNIFIDLCEYAQRVLDEEVDDDKIFALLFTPDKEDSLEDNFESIAKSNPLQYFLESGKEYLEDEYKKALEIGKFKLTSFITKHYNTFLDGAIGEVFVEQEILINCKTPKDSFDWYGLEDIVIGLDLAFVSDNLACSFTYYDKDTENIFTKNICFIPRYNVERKTKLEGVDYQALIDDELVYATGDNFNSIKEVFDIITGYIEEYRWKDVTIVLDQWNASGMAEMFDVYRYDMQIVRLKNSSYTLGAGINLLERSINENTFRYEENELLEINFNNSKCTYDTNMQKYVNKKKSNGKVDIMFSLFNALTVTQIKINEILGQPEFILA